jgi:hypothetical protein
MVSLDIIRNWLPAFRRNRAMACGEPADLARSDAMYQVEKGMCVIVNVKGARSLFPCDRIGWRPALAAPLRRDA